MSGHVCNHDEGDPPYRSVGYRREERLGAKEQFGVGTHGKDQYGAWNEHRQKIHHAQEKSPRGL